LPRYHAGLSTLAAAYKPCEHECGKLKGQSAADVFEVPGPIIATPNGRTYRTTARKLRPGNLVQIVDVFT
jgi:hypothetical protein